MARRILIVSHSADHHAFAVQEALERKGVEVAFLTAPDLPDRLRASIFLDREPAGCRLEGPGLRFDGPADTVWFRRPSVPVLPDFVHPADRGMADRECRALSEALWAFVGPEGWWVNPPAAAGAARRKPVQLRLARDAGWTIPPTLCSNDPQEIRAFLADRGGRMVYKPLDRPGAWQGDGEVEIQYTGVVTADDLPPDRLLRAVPGLYQALVPKRHELRVTVLGERVFAARIDSQKSAATRTDWRVAPHQIPLTPERLQPDLEERCRTLTRSLGLVFGALDLIVTPDGEVVFLEVNESGQFLFVEQVTGLPLLDAMAEFLIQGRRDFLWNERRVEVRLADVDADVDRRVAAASELHVPPPPLVQQE